VYRIIHTPGIQLRYNGLVKASLYEVQKDCAAGCVVLKHINISTPWCWN